MGITLWELSKTQSDTAASGTGFTL